LAKEIIIVTRKNIPNELMQKYQVGQVHVEKNLNLPESINFGLSKSKGDFFSWICDDDYYSESYISLIEILKNNPNVGMVYGGCNYVDINGQTIATNSPKKFAMALTQFGPNFISQPSTLFRKDLVASIDGCNTNLKYAFDQDLIIRLARVAPIKCFNKVVSNYTYHPETLTNKNRLASIRESYFVRKNNGNLFMKGLNLLFYPITFFFIYASTLLFTKKSKSL
jgi:glycosyltransferase involved in cell wall biosynthesis